MYRAKKKSKKIEQKVKKYAPSLSLYSVKNLYYIKKSTNAEKKRRNK